MAELKITDLPLMTEGDFTANDRFLMIDDGSARAMTKAVFESWVANNLQGEQGEQGLAGKDGAAGVSGTDGTDGTDGLSAYQVALQTGFVGTQSQWLASLKGTTGTAGTDGFNGWTPNLRAVNRDSDVVLQVFDWFGGTGTRPTVTGYVGSTGIVSNIANATNIKGSKGDTGLQGIQGEQGEAGVDGKTVESITFNQNLSATVLYTDGTSVTSETPPKQYGWGTYKDGQYTDTATLNIPINTQEVLPNNATVKVEHLPTDVTTFYDTVAQKYTLDDSEGYYSVRVRFKVAPANQASTINISMSKATTDTPYSEDKTLRGDNKIQDMSFSTTIYGDSPISTNGLTILIKTFDRAISIYNIEVTVAKLI